MADINYSPQGPLAGFLFGRQVQREEKQAEEESKLRQLDIQKGQANYREWLANTELRAAERQLRTKAAKIDTAHLEEIKRVERQSAAVDLKAASVNLSEAQRDWFGNELSLVKSDSDWTKLKRKARVLGVDLGNMQGKSWEQVQDVMGPVRDKIIENVPFERELRLIQARGLYLDKDGKPRAITVPSVTNSERKDAVSYLTDLEITDSSGDIIPIGSKMSKDDQQVYANYLLTEAKALQRELGDQGQAVGLQTLMSQIHEDSKGVIKSIDPWGPNLFRDTLVLDREALQKRATAHLYSKDTDFSDLPEGGLDLPEGLSDTQVTKAMELYGVSREEVIRRYNAAQRRTQR